LTIKRIEYSFLEESGITEQKDILLEKQKTGRRVCKRKKKVKK
jgi:hypothetical protein